MTKQAGTRRKSTTAKSPGGEVSTADTSAPSTALVPATGHTPTAKEKLSLEAHFARRKNAKPIPKQIIENVGGVANLKDDHPDPAVGASLTMEALGLTRVGELTAVLQHFVELTQKDRKADAHGLNQMMAQMAALEPSDGIEAMLSAQMTAVHNAAMKAARQLRGSDTIPQQDSNGNIFNKLARTFATQVDALKRYRSRGEQKVVVEHRHYHLAPGAQAVFGDVVPPAGGGAAKESEELPHVRSLPERTAVLGDVQTNETALPRAGSEGLERVPIPRRTRRADAGAGSQ